MEERTEIYEELQRLTHEERREKKASPKAKSEVDTPNAGRTNCRPDKHEWVDFSTAVAERWIMLQCVECGSHGVVTDPRSEEWSLAFHAPSQPYRWGDPSRVTIKKQVSKDQRYVIRRAAGPICDCYSRRGILLPAEYERFPIEFVRSFKAETDADRKELREIARFVSTTDLCSFLFPLFLRESASHCGAAGRLVTAIANRIELADSRGLHCSPAVVAQVLRRAAGLRL